MGGGPSLILSLIQNVISDNLPFNGRLMAEALELALLVYVDQTLWIHSSYYDGKVLLIHFRLITRQQGVLCQ